MRVFVTGASGWIGSAALDELLAAGHEVVGLARSATAAAAVEAKGAHAHPGDLDDLDSIRAGAKDAEAVVHLANKHDWADPAASDAAERAAVQAIGETLAGTGRPFLLASGFVALAEDRPATETDVSPFHGPDSLRGGSENLALGFVEQGVHTVSLRFPIVHGAGDPGFLASVAAVARQHGVSGYPGDGTNRWPAVHRGDAGRFVVRALARARAGSCVHAVAEEGVSSREIAEAIGAALGLPTAAIAPQDVPEHFGWVGRFFAADLPASSVLSREILDWTPSAPALLADIAAGAYSAN